jgi:uncharacterized protein
MDGVASSPPTFVWPRANPSTTRSLRITTPARRDLACPCLKLSATPSARMPGLFRCSLKQVGQKEVLKLLTSEAARPTVAKIYGLKTGARVPEAIVEIAEREKVKTAKVEAIGGVLRLKLAYFNHLTKKYEQHEFNEFLEVTGLIGNITMKDSKQFLHVHGTFGRKDLSVIGGHVMTAEVYPILEVFITPTRNTALRKFDEKIGLNVIYKSGT